MATRAQIENKQRGIRAYNATVTHEQNSENAKKSAEAVKRSHKMRKTLREMFADRLTEETSEKIADEFIGILLDKTVRVSDRTHLLETICRIIGEYDRPLGFGEVNQLAEIIKIKIE